LKGIKSAGGPSSPGSLPGSDVSVLDQQGSGGGSPTGGGTDGGQSGII